MELNNFLDQKLGELQTTKELQNIIKNVLLVSYDFNIYYPSAQIDFISTWPKLETAYPFEKYMSQVVLSLIISRS